MYFECPDSVAILPSSDWPMWPTITRSSTVPFRSGPNTSAQVCGRGCWPLRNIVLKSSHGSEEEDLLEGKLAIGTQNQNHSVVALTMRLCTSMPQKSSICDRNDVAGTVFYDSCHGIESIGMIEVQTGASSALFGGQGHTSVSRGLGEFQGGRPVLI